MGHKMTWLDEPWSMRVDYSELTTVDDLEEVMSVCIPAAQKHPINFLIDFREVEQVEPALLRSPAFLELFRQPNTKWFAMVGAKGLVRMGVALFGRYMSAKHFNDVESALAFLEEMVAHQKQMAHSKDVQTG
jgi:hypothetical protein